MYDEFQEELLRLHQSAGDGRAARPHSYGPEKTAQVASMPWVATALVMAFIGIIIGKFLMWINGLQGLAVTRQHLTNTAVTPLPTRDATIKKFSRLTTSD